MTTESGDTGHEDAEIDPVAVTFDPNLVGGVSDIGFGRPMKNKVDCCTKPRGCMITNPSCLFLKHPWKRANVFHDPTVRCQATSVDDGTVSGEWRQLQCRLLNGHDGPHDVELRT